MLDGEQLDCESKVSEFEPHCDTLPIFLKVRILNSLKDKTVINFIVFFFKIKIIKFVIFIYLYYIYNMEKRIGHITTTSFGTKVYLDKEAEIAKELANRL